MNRIEHRTDAELGVTRHSGASRSLGVDHICLAQTIQAAASAIDRTTLKPAGSKGLPPACQPATLLTVVAYCYALQVFGSAEIEALLRRDTNLRSFCNQQLPNARAIRHFRRDNRESLQLCLEAALRFLTEQKVAQGIITRVNQSQISEEARRRIVAATFIDSLQMEKDHSTDTSIDLCYLVAKSRFRAH